MILFIRKIFSGIFGTAQYQKYFDNYVASNSLALFFIHCLSIVLVFLSNFILVKIAGVSNYGGYVYLFNLVYLLVTFSILGLDTLLVKKVAVFNDTKKYPQLKGIVLFALFIIVISSIIVAALFKIISNLSGSLNFISQINWFAFALISLLMLSAMSLSQVVLQGMKKIVWSQVGEKIIRPMILIALVITFYLFSTQVTLQKLIWINVLSIAITLTVILIFCKKTIGSKLKKIKAEYDLKNWIAASMSFFVVDFLYNFNARISIFLLGIFKSGESIGIFNIALRVSEIISFSLVIINFVLSPVIANLYANGKKEKLQIMITRSARGTLFIGLLLTAIILLFSKNILGLFGARFISGQVALIILGVGQLINILCGSVGLLLLMTGNQRFSIYSLAMGTAINLILNFILVPKYGIMGSAIASSASLITWNLMMYYFVRRKLDIRTTAFGFL
ncbi:MAG: polysaccharide biosynthesis C-terminal domain-containing protein [Ginsengibacter sp.]